MRTIITKQRMEAVLSIFNKTMETTSEDAFFLQGAYGGWQLMRKIPGTTAADSITTGFRSKREMFDTLMNMDIAVAIFKDKKAIEERLNSLVDNPASA